MSLFIVISNTKYIYEEPIINDPNLLNSILGIFCIVLFITIITYLYSKKNSD